MASIDKDPPSEAVEEFKRLDSEIGIHSDPRKSIPVAEAALELAQKYHWKWGIAYYEAAVGVCHANAGDFQPAKDRYEIAIPLMEAVDPGNALIFKNNYGNLIVNREPHRALQFHREARDGAIEYGAEMVGTQINALNGLGNVYNIIGLTDRAIEYYLEAIRLAKSVGGRDSIIRMNVAEIHRNRKEYEEALQYCQTAIGVDAERGMTRSVATYRPVLSDIYRDMGMLDRAEAVARESLAETRALQIGDHNAARVLGNALASGNLFEEAVEWLEYAFQSEDPSEKKTAGIDLAVVLLTTDPQRAYEILLELHITTSNLEDRQFQSQCILQLSKTLSAMERYSEALDYLRKHNEIRDEINSKQSRQQLLAYRIEQEMEKHEAMAQQLQTQKDNLERELSNSTLQLISQTELLSELRDSLLAVIRKFPLPDGAATELRERLKALPCKSIDWQRFDTQFKAAHPEFTKKLLEQYPTLTPTELRMCSLLRMNLRSAEIARLLCISERTVEHHRAHIRSKMKLASGQDLILHLAKL
jgi:tetratricopeptide (TPR) repeat protein